MDQDSNLKKEDAGTGRLAPPRYPSPAFRPGSPAHKDDKSGEECDCDESEATFFRVALVSKNDVQTLLWICDTKNKQAAHAVAGRLQAWINGIYV
jgi:hypothetical protein